MKTKILFTICIMLLLIGNVTAQISKEENNAYIESLIKNKTTEKPVELFEPVNATQIFQPVELDFGIFFFYLFGIGLIVLFFLVVLWLRSSGRTGGEL